MHSIAWRRRCFGNAGKKNLQILSKSPLKSRPFFLMSIVRAQHSCGEAANAWEPCSAGISSISASHRVDNLFPAKRLMENASACADHPHITEAAVRGQWRSSLLLWSFISVSRMRPLGYRWCWHIRSWHAFLQLLLDKGTTFPSRSKVLKPCYNMHLFPG